MEHRPRVELARDSLAHALAAYMDGAQTPIARVSGAQSASAPDRIAHLQDCVRYYTKVLRTEGEQAQPVLKGLMDVVHDTLPNDPQMAKCRPSWRSGASTPTTIRARPSRAFGDRAERTLPLREDRVLVST